MYEYVLQVQCGVCTEYLGRAGLGIRSSVFEQIAHFLWPKERFACEKGKIAPVPLLPWATLANCSWSLFSKKSNGSDFFTVALLSWVTRVNCSRRSLKRSNWAKSNGSNSLWAKKEKISEKPSNTYQNLEFFLSQALIFESNLLESPANHSCCSFLQSNSLTINQSINYERPEQSAHGSSLVKRDKSAGLRSLFFKEWCERIAHSRSIIYEHFWAIERIPNPEVGNVLEELRG